MKLTAFSSLFTFYFCGLKLCACLMLYSNAADPVEPDSSGVKTERGGQIESNKGL